MCATFGYWIRYEFQVYSTNINMHFESIVVKSKSTYMFMATMFWCHEIVIDIADYLYVGHPFGKIWHLLWFSYTLLQTGLVNLKVQTETSTSRVFFISIHTT